MYRKIIKVFLASPGDLESERKAAKAIVDEENANHANNLNYQIDLVGWEDTVSQRRRAQDAINTDLDQCEYFVGMMWKKWGTPPGPVGSPYTSGFEEEYRRSVDRHKLTGKPEISLLFKTIEKEALEDIGKQLEQVLSFQDGITKEQNQLYQKFEDQRDFEQKFRAIIAKFLRDQQSEDQSLESIDPQKPKRAEEQVKDQQKGENSAHVIEGGARRFLEEFLEKENGESPYSAEEAARFRLLAATISQSGNDNLTLGTHDANLIYRYFRNTDLSGREKRGLFSTGLENLQNKTIPIWHWLFEYSREPADVLPFRTLFKSDRQRRNAFWLLEKLTIAPSDFTCPIEASRFPSFWFSDDAPDDLVVAALEYLGAVGDEGLEVDWEKLTSSSEVNIAQAALRARVQIGLQNSPKDAWELVANHEGVNLGNTLTSALLATANSVETDLLRNCLKNRTTALVKEVAKELLQRAVMTKADAQLICESADAETRLIGAMALATLEPELTLADARKLIIRPRSTGALGFFASGREHDYPGEEAFEKYKISVLSKHSYEVLQELQKDESLFSNGVTLALYSQYFKHSKTQLESNLLDGFNKFCSKKRSPLLSTAAEPNTTTFNFVRESLLQSALEIFCSHASRADIGTVRKVLDKNDIKFAREIASFLDSYGEWEDIKRISKLSQNRKFALGATLLSGELHSDNYNLSAKAILKLGSKRIADTWRIELSAPVRVQLILEMTKKLFSAFDDSRIIEMLSVENDDVREAVALKAVLCFTKSRIRKVLAAYFEGDGIYYYNSIFWLDLGLSADVPTGQAVALKVIEAKKSAY